MNATPKGKTLTLTQIEQKLKQILDFFPIEKLTPDKKNGDYYVTQIV